MRAAAKSSRGVRCIWAAQAVLGEAPLWVAAEDAIYWVDIKRAQLLRYYVANGRAERCTMPEPISALAPISDGRLLCAARRSLHALDTRSGSLVTLARPRLAAGDIRINDGCVHPDGTFWFGTMDRAERAPIGNFHRQAADGGGMIVPAGYAITNGPAFSPDGDIGYFVDTLRRRILSAPVENGQLAAPLRLFAEIAIQDGYPDGLAIDTEGGVWCAHWGGARVTRFDANGRISDAVRLPVANVTKCAFGGEQLDRLFVTSARKGLDAAALASQTLAGGLFEIDVGHRGLPPHHFHDTTMHDATEAICIFGPA